MSLSNPIVYQKPTSNNMTFYYYGVGSAHPVFDLKLINQCLLIEMNRHPEHYWPNYGSIQGTYYQGYKLVEVQR